MQDIGMISTALVFIIQMFLCQVMDAHPELEYITLKMFLRTCFCKVSNYSFLTELQEKDKELFTLMSSSQKCHAIVWACMHGHKRTSVVFSVALWPPCPWF